MKRKEEKWDEFMEDAMDASEEHRYADVIKYLNLAEEAGYKENMLYALRGNCYNMLLNHEAALKDLSIYFENKKDDFDMYFVRAGIYTILNDFESAMADYEKGFNSVNIAAFHYYLRGDCFYNLFDFKSAVEYFDTAESLGYTDDLLYRQRGGAHFFLKHYKKAKKDILISLKQNDDDQGAHFLLSLIEEKNKNYEEALKHINHAIYLDGEGTTYYEHREKIYVVTNQPEKAELDAVRIKEITTKETIKRKAVELKAVCEQLKKDGIIDEYRLPDEE